MESVMDRPTTSHEQPQTTESAHKNTEKMNRLFLNLERKLLSELNHQIDITFLDLYIREELVSRGLRVNLVPTFNDDKSFFDTWGSITNECSIKLMHLLKNRRKEICDKISIDINLLLLELEDYYQHKNYSTFRQELMTVILKNELDVIQKKKRKFLRDREDKKTGKYRATDRSAPIKDQSYPNSLLGHHPAAPIMSPVPKNGPHTTMRSPADRRGKHNIRQPEVTIHQLRFP